MENPAIIDLLERMSSNITDLVKVSKELAAVSELHSQRLAALEARNAKTVKQANELQAVWDARAGE